MSEQQGQQEAQTSNVVDDVPFAGEKASVCCASFAAKRVGMRILLYTLVVLVLAAVSYYAAMRLPLAVPSDASSALSARLDEIEMRTKRVEDSLAKVTTSSAGTEVVAPPQETMSNSAEIDQLKTGLAGLAGALGQLQVELEKSSKITNEDRLNTQAGLATVIAFFQMERMALGGKPFENDRLTLRKLADSDQALVDMLITLEPYAVHGVATPVKLINGWRAKSSEAQAALRKAGAQTWIDRIVVALEGLISIRSIAPGAGDSLAFAAVTIDMEEGNLAAAIQKADAMPAEVQAMIKPWLDAAKARLLVENTLASMNEHLIARGAVPATDSAASSDQQPLEPAPVPAGVKE